MLQVSIRFDANSRVSFENTGLNKFQAIFRHGFRIFAEIKAKNQTVKIIGGI
jgi:hypothetical protein